MFLGDRVLSYIIIVTLLFIIINLYLSNYDFMHPSFLFCFVFFISEIFCFIFKNKYSIYINLNTFYVLTIGFLVFTIINVLFRNNIVTNKNIIKYTNIKYISIPNKFIFALIIIQILTIVFNVVYLKDIAIASGKSDLSIFQCINLYDHIIKFEFDFFMSLNVHKPLIYKLGFPLISCLGYVLIYIMVNNFVALKKIKVIHVIAVLFMCISFILTGGRSDIFRTITFAFVIYYILSLKKGNFKAFNLKFLFKIILGCLIITIIMFLLMFLMGRNKSIGNIFEYLFVYLGGPVFNLNTFLDNNITMFFLGDSSLFGKYTIQPFFNFIGRNFAIQDLLYNNIYFVTNAGNVYTTYYEFIYDFGYIGIIPMLLIMAGYYVITYSNIIYNEISFFDYKLFIYAYLFNDLLMSFFMNRFYTTILSGPFFKFLFVFFFFYGIIKYNKTSIVKEKS